MIAIYARKSLDKKDSISIETQLQKCKDVCNEDCIEYKDPGYSGASTNRPDFQRMISDIKAGKITKVISYRLDRISRSLTDFAKLIELFQKYNVEFASATEQFDTGSPMGRAMVYIIMVFAQLERETIASRIRDNYFARASKGMFLGGGCPFGYKPTRAEVNGKIASVLEPDPEHAKTVTKIFEDYINGSGSLYGIAMGLPGKWTANKVRRIIKNPVYVENTPDVYEYYKLQGYKIENGIEDFDGNNGCLLVGKEKDVHKSTRKVTDISDQTLLIGLHEPLVDSYTFLQAQKKLSKNKVSKRSGTSEFSWLTGLVKCNHCGHSITVKRSLSRGKEYLHLVCRGRTNYGLDICNNTTHYNLKDIESRVEPVVLETISSLDYSDIEKNKPNQDDIRIKADIIKIDEKINNLIDQMADGIVGTYIQKKIEDLDKQKKDLQSQLTANDINPDLKKLLALKDTIYEIWGKANIRERHTIAEMAVKRVFLSSDGEIDINLNV